MANGNTVNGVFTKQELDRFHTSEPPLICRTHHSAFKDAMGKPGGKKILHFDIITNSKAYQYQFTAFELCVGIYDLFLSAHHVYCANLFDKIKFVKEMFELRVKLKDPTIMCSSGFWTCTYKNSVNPPTENQAIACAASVQALFIEDALFTSDYREQIKEVINAVLGVD